MEDEDADEYVVFIFFWFFEYIFFLGLVFFYYRVVEEDAVEAADADVDVVALDVDEVVEDLARVEVEEEAVVAVMCVLINESRNQPHQPQQ